MNDLFSESFTKKQVVNVKGEMKIKCFFFLIENVYLYRLDRS